jgi:aldose 1-epimerase
VIFGNKTLFLLFWAFAKSMLASDHTDLDMNISSIEITADNISARLINYGATLTHFKIDQIDVVLGFDDPTDYVSVGSKSNPYFGCIVGRVANR